MVSLVFLGVMPLKAHRYRQAPGSGVKLTFRLNVVAQTPHRGDGNPLLIATERRRVTLSWIR
jgi:hypothetical protein